MADPIKQQEAENIAATVAREARKPFAIKDDADALMVAIPDGWKLESTENQLPSPLRKKASVLLADSDSFVSYMRRHGSLASATIWCEADYQKGLVAYTGIINDHGEEVDGQQWRDHIAKLTPAKSVEWQRWTNKDRQRFSQAEFACWIEDNMGDIATADGFPSGTAMLTMATNLEIAQDSTIKSAIRLQSGGVRMEYVEDSNAETVKSMEVFSRFAIGVPVFWGGSAYMVEARLKYQLKGGKVDFWYELNRPDKVLEDAAKTLTSTIKGETGIPLFHGKPGV